MNFWSNVQFLFKMRSISAKDFASKNGINIFSFRNSISQKRLPNLEMAYKIATGLDVSIEYLLTGNDKNNPDNDIENLRTKYIESKKAEYEKELKQKLDSLSKLK